jgi:CTP:molybdopterin cytidylyltransferase MocA
LESDVLVFCHVDRPVPDKSVFDALTGSERAVAVACHKGKKAPPVCITAVAKKRLLNSDATRLDHWVMSEEEVAYVEVADPSVHYNANTDKALKRYFG